MKITITIIVFAAMAVVVLAAPAPVHQQKRSHYAPASYSSPCAAVPSHLPPVYLPSRPLHAVPFNLASYGYPAAHYRAHDALDVLPMFADIQHSDEEHEAIARTYGGYEAPAAAHLGGGAAYGLPAVPSGPAMGVFPHTNVGGCNVPLLLSCSPSIVPGRMVHAKPHHGHGGVFSGALYRGEEMHSFKPLRSSEGLHATNIHTEAESQTDHAAHIKHSEHPVQDKAAHAVNAANNHAKPHHGHGGVSSETLNRDVEEAVLATSGEEMHSFGPLRDSQGLHATNIHTEAESQTDHAAHINHAKHAVKANAGHAVNAANNHAKPHHGHGGVSSGALYRGLEEAVPAISGEEMNSFEPLRDSQGLHATNIHTEAESQTDHAAHINHAKHAVKANAGHAVNAANNHAKPHHGHGGVSSGALYRGLEEAVPAISGEEMNSFEPLRDSQGLHATNIHTEAESQTDHAAYINHAKHAVKANAGHAVNAANNHAMTHN